MDHIEARTVPLSVAVCPICGGGLWIESINSIEYEQEDSIDGIEFTLTCQTEPAVGAVGWSEWYRDHFSTPYIDWLPIDSLVEQWLLKPAQQARLRTIWENGAVLAQ
jgi:hypothetical protein